MTMLCDDILKDDRFKRCLEARITGKVTMEYRPPFPQLNTLEQQLAKSELAAKSTNDLGIHELVAYMRDFVSLLKSYAIDPEALELALQEFAVQKI